MINKSVISPFTGQAYVVKKEIFATMDFYRITFGDPIRVNKKYRQTSWKYHVTDNKNMPLVRLPKGTILIFWEKTLSVPPYWDFYLPNLIRGHSLVRHLSVPFVSVFSRQVKPLSRRSKKIKRLLPHIKRLLVRIHKDNLEVLTLFNKVQTFYRFGNLKA